MKWVIVCRDGAKRHYPYANEEDARGDASIWSRDGITCTKYPPNYVDRSIIDALGECPGGHHDVQRRDGPDA